MLDGHNSFYEYLISYQRELSSPVLPIPDPTVWSEDDLLIVDFLDVSFPAAASAAPDTRASASAVGVVGDSTDGTFCGCS